MRTLPFVITGLVLATASAAADRPKYTRKQHVEIDVKLSNRVKPAEPRATAPAAPISADAVLEIEERTQPIRREQEAVLVKLVHDTPDDDPDKPDLMFRLAEHYAKQLRFWRLEAVGQTLQTRQQLPSSRVRVRQDLP